jgi:hypothetical protein
LRQTKGVQRLLARQFARTDSREPGPNDQGFNAAEELSK